MIANPLVGIPLHWLGGLASGSFYVPYRAVRGWSWEIYWLFGGFCAWVVCPMIFALSLTNDLFEVIIQQSAPTLFWTFLFGLLWGLGGMTYGLTMRYLGISLGTGIALGNCAVFGTLMPPILKIAIPSISVTESIVEIAAVQSGQITLVGLAICVCGIALAAFGGRQKERELSVTSTPGEITEFNFVKGIWVATFCGIASACFAFALTAGNPIGAETVVAGTDPLWSGLPKLVVVLWGGFVTNLLWCGYLIVRNGTIAQYFKLRAASVAVQPTFDDPAISKRPPRADGASDKATLAKNYVFCIIAGTTWYLQFFFYTMGETQMGQYGFASWTVHMASIIIFATIWGWILNEWKGSSRKVYIVVASGMILLIASTVVIGLGTYLKSKGSI
jgi:L-rhamnose-H+ transport protein